MDCQKIGKLILQLRQEKNLTQRELAELMNISDKAISKWERGLGCPDVSLLNELSDIFEINIENILSGDLGIGNRVSGNMKKVKFYVCPTCGNVITTTHECDVSCCGRQLKVLTVQKCDEDHQLYIDGIEDEYYIHFSHEMTKMHYIHFIAYVSWDRVMVVKMYPEQSGELRIPRISKGQLYFYCSQDGLFQQNI